MLKRLALAVALGATWAAWAATPAHAQTEDDQGDLIAMGGDYTPESWPIERVLQPPVLARGLRQVELALGASVGAEPGQPVTLAPGFSSGLSDKLTLLVRHRGGLCLGEAAVCPVRYGGLRGLLRFGLARVPYKVHVALQGGLSLDDVDPVIGGAELGLAVKLMFGRVGLELEPVLAIALNQRDIRTRELLVFPAELQVGLAQRLTLTVLATLSGGISNFDDTGRFGVGAGVWWSPGRKLDLGAELRFVAAAGAAASADLRTLTVAARRRW